MTISRYKEAGVDIKRGNDFVSAIKDTIKKTSTPFVLSGIGPFAGLFSLGCIGEHDYALVASADGVGTMTRRSNAMKEYSIVGQSLVNHCVNDILTVGATPLFFLDYIAASRLDISSMSQVVEGLAIAAQQNGCAIIGGETAEMPKVYGDGEYDLAGFIVGIVETKKIITGKSICDGDILIGLPSSGIHTNGYSLVNKLIEQRLINVYDSQMRYTAAYKQLFNPHVSYLSCIKPMLNLKLIEGMAHITGGGFDNILRIVPDGFKAVIRANTWFIPPIFKAIQEAGSVDPVEMFHVYNMGIGMVLVVKPYNLEHFTRYFDGEYTVIGHIAKSEEKVWEFV